MRKILALFALVAVIGAVLFFAENAHAQVVPAQNQITTAPYGGLVYSSSTSGTAKLGQLLGTAAGNIVLWDGTKWTSVATSTLGISGGVTSVNSATGTVTLTVANIGSALQWVGTQLRIPTAGTSITGLLSDADWNTFNGKQDAITLTTTGTSGAATFIGNILNIPNYATGGSGGGLSTSTPWTAGNLAYVINDSTVGSVATGTLSTNATGLQFDNTRGLVGGAATLSLTSGYTIPLIASTTEWAQAYASTTVLTNSYIRGLFSNTATGLTYNSATGATTLTANYSIPLTASTTNWQSFYTTPSTRITDGTGLTWSGNTLNCDTASGSVQGCLSSTDWTTFNGKQAAGNYITALTGDVTASGPGSTAATLATVNANVGSFGSATAAPIFTVNGKGLITAASSATITPAIGSITGLGTGVATALGINIGSAGAPVLFNGALGTPSSGTLTNATGLPIVAGTIGTLTETRGGTNQTSYTTGDMLYASGANTLAKRAIGTTGDVLSVVGGVPSWVATSTLGFSGGSGCTGTIGQVFYASATNTCTGTSTIFIDSEDVGIGTTTLTSRLTVGSSVGATTGTNESIGVNSMGFAGLVLNGDTSNVSGEPGGAYIKLNVDGNMSTSSSGFFLSRVNTAGTNGMGGSFTGTLSNSALIGTIAGNPLHLGTNGAVTMTFDTSNNVGIGTTTPDRILSVVGTGLFSGIVDFLNGIRLLAGTYLNWGTVAGASGYGFRDNSGTMEFKNSGGAWAPFGTSINYQAFTANGTWTKPSGLTGNEMITVMAWGGGGGGGNATAFFSAAGGGGGGTCVVATFRASDFGATETITVGAGGGAGVAGASTTVGSILTAWGGGFGGNASTGDFYSGGGGGGGSLSAGGNSTQSGGNATGGAGGGPLAGTNGSAAAGGDSTFGGGGGAGVSTNGAGSFAGGRSYYGGGGGGAGKAASTAGAGGASFCGGGGGGGGAASGTAGAGGTSVQGGAGGAGATAAGTGTNGTAPGGAGGGSGRGGGGNGSGGSGARGEVRIWVTK